MFFMMGFGISFVLGSKVKKASIYHLKLFIQKWLWSQLPVIFAITHHPFSQEKAKSSQISIVYMQGLLQVW